jgi:hypothetical protein
MLLGQRVPALCSTTGRAPAPLASRGARRGAPPPRRAAATRAAADLAATLAPPPIDFGLDDNTSPLGEEDSLHCGADGSVLARPEIEAPGDGRRFFIKTFGCQMK